MLKIVTMLWDANAHSADFSRCYDESWVVKLFDGFARNLTRPHQFVLFTDRRRYLGDRDVLQIMIDAEPSYAAYVEPYRLDDAMILVGLDTIITGNVDHLADYCLNANMLALPVDPFHPTTVCNGVALVPAGQRRIYDAWRGENDMEWMRRQRYKTIDALFPGHVVSYKGNAKGYGLRDARMVYFHGHEKPHELPDVEWIKAHWRIDRLAWFAAQCSAMIAASRAAEDDGVPPGFEIPAGFVSSKVQPISALPNTRDEILFRNIEINSQRKLPWLTEAPAHDGVAVICGGGPSLDATMPFIRGHAKAGHTILALNNAAAFLRARDVVPTYQVIIDPRPENIRFVTEVPADHFILSSQCDPSLFDALDGHDVTVLHPAVEGVREHLPPGTIATLVGGGITVGLTAMAAVHVLGFREIHLYGYDSSDADDGNAHAYPQDENDPEKKRIEVIVAGRRFRSSYAMYAQAEKFESFARLLADADATVYVHGDGLLPTIAREMSKGDDNGLQAG